MWAFAHSSRSRRWTAIRSRSQREQQACWWTSLRWFLTVCAEILWLCKPIVAAAVRAAGLRRSWRWRRWMWRSRAYCREINIQFTYNSSGGYSCSQHANCTLPLKLATSVALCCVIKLHILEWPFIVASLRHTCAIIMLCNQYLDMPHRWGGWIISAKEKCSLTQI